jgi:gliding motility-associated-like protein
MSKQNPDIDRLFRQRFDDWEAPHDPGEAHEVFNQVQQNLAQPGSGGSSTGSDGGTFMGSGAKGLLGGVKGWLITGVTALMISGGAGYLFYTSEDTTTPKDSGRVQADSLADRSSAQEGQRSGKTAEPKNRANNQTAKKDGEANPTRDAFDDAGQQSDAPQSDERNRNESKGLNKERTGQSFSKAKDSRKQSLSKHSKKPSSKQEHQDPTTSSDSERDSNEPYRLQVPDTSLCTYEKLRFSVQGLLDGRTLSYKIGDSPFQIVQGNRHLVSVPSSDKHPSLVIRIVGDHVHFDTQKLRILPQPTADFNVQKPGPHQVLLKAETAQSVNHQWLLGNGEQKRQAKLRYTYKTGGAKTIRMIAANGQGCMDTAQKRIRLKSAPEVDLPNIFTPNGDGRNDKLVVSHGSLDSFRLVIKNEQGEVVFSSSDPERSWNGKVNNEGDLCNEGAYQYVLSYQYEFSPKFYQKTGKLLLKRSAFK